MKALLGSRGRVVLELHIVSPELRGRAVMRAPTAIWSSNYKGLAAKTQTLAALKQMVEFS